MKAAVQIQPTGDPEDAEADCRCDGGGHGRVVRSVEVLGGPQHDDRPDDGHHHARHADNDQADASGDEVDGCDDHHDLNREAEEHVRHNATFHS